MKKLYDWVGQHPLASVLGVIFLSLFLHLPSLSLAPNGFHKWRETDTATVTENLAFEKFGLAQTRVNARGETSGVVGMELPFYNLTVAGFYRVFGFYHAFARLFSFLGTISAALALMILASHFFRQPKVTFITLHFLFFAPLVFFYGFKIQPDIWALAASLWGFVLIAETRMWSLRLLGSLSLALAGCIKPTFLSIGLPIAYRLWTQDKGFLRNPLYWFLGVIPVASVGLWLAFARELTELPGYFYLGGEGLLKQFAYMGDAKFYQHVLLTWPFEMVIGIPYVVFFFIGWRKLNHRPLFVLWLTGCFLVFGLASEHCATLHDYYYLPAVAPLILVTARGAYRAIENTRGGLLVLCLTLMFLAPLNGILRTKSRYDFNPMFHEARAKAGELIQANETVVAVDRMPGDVLYRSGQKGWRFDCSVVISDLLAVKSDWIIILDHPECHRDLRSVGFELRASEAGLLWWQRLK